MNRKKVFINRKGLHASVTLFYLSLVDVVVFLKGGFIYLVSGVTFGKISTL